MFLARPHPAYSSDTFSLVGARTAHPNLVWPKKTFTVEMNQV